MPANIIIGGQFGDEGKGKIISYIATKDDPEIIVRGGVGPNAGHTVVYNGEELKLRMLPSGVINKNSKLMISAGVLIDINVLFREIENTNSESRVLIDNLCGIIENKHINIDKKGHLKNKIGTTGTGTGPAQSDRILRVAKTASETPELKKLLGNVSYEVNNSLDKKEKILIEGTQGTFLSLYHGTYPYVTSKDVTASGLCSDIGIGPKRINEVILVIKSYTTRVGAGPLKDELTINETKKRGWQEIGTVTGRMRRAAPLNLDLIKKASILNSATQIALTKLDILFPECKGITKISELTPEAHKFIKDIENFVKVPITFIGTGKDNSEIIDIRNN